MKKNLYKLFDGTTPEELEPFADALGAPDLPPETLSAVKEKVYAKTGLKSVRKSRKYTWYRLGALAACLALIAGAIALVLMLHKASLPAVPVWEDARYTAAEIAMLFDETKSNDGTSTNAYTKVYVPDPQYLYIGQLPEDDYLAVYQRVGAQKALDKEEFRAFLDGILPKLAPVIEIDVPDCKIKEWEGLTKDLEIFEYVGKYLLISDQNESYTRFHLSTQSVADDRNITLSGVPVQIDQRLSDEEILRSLQPVKSILFELFGVSFPNMKISRSFNSYSEYGASWIEIYFYDETAHALNRTLERPVSDHIAICFENVKNHADDIVSDGVLNVAFIDYYQYRTGGTEEISPIAKAKKLSLEEAEGLLYNGYVFGGHACSLCMAAQDKVSFEGYDFVDLEYVFGRDKTDGQWTTGIPFYAFYKNIGSSENGNNVYAKTYVPAIEVKGLDAYFQSQTKNHRTGSVNTIE